MNCLPERTDCSYLACEWKWVLWRRQSTAIMDCIHSHRPLCSYTRRAKTMALELLLQSFCAESDVQFSLAIRCDPPTTSDVVHKVPGGWISDAIPNCLLNCSFQTCSQYQPATLNLVAILSLFVHQSPVPSTWIKQHMMNPEMAVVFAQPSPSSASRPTRSSGWKSIAVVWHLRDVFTGIIISLRIWPAASRKIPATSRCHSTHLLYTS